MTGNQVVAYNLFLGRILRGLTQEDAAERLEPFLGERWSKATFSAAERSVSGRRIRQFDADEIVGFARGLDLPVWWFFVPPEEDTYGRLPKITPPAGVDEGQLLNPRELLARVVDLEGLLARFEAASATLTPDDREQPALRLESFSRELYVWASDRQKVRGQLGDEEIEAAEEER